MNENGLIYVSWVGEYLICPRRLWLRIKNNVPIIPTLEMKKGRFLHKLNDEINKAVKQAGSREECPPIIARFIEFIRPYCEVFDLDFDFLSEVVRKEVWKDFLMREKGIEIMTEYPLKSFELGISGKIDRVEFYRDGSVGLWEIKTGNNNNTSEYHKIQLALYKTLLELEGAPFVQQTTIKQINQKQENIVPIVLEERDIQRAKEVIQEIKKLLASTEMPKAEPNKKCLYCPQNIACLCPVFKNLVGVIRDDGS